MFAKSNYNSAENFTKEVTVDYNIEVDKLNTIILK